MQIRKPVVQKKKKNAFPFFWVKWVYHKLYIFQFQIFDTNWPSLLYSMINVAGQIKWRQSQIFCHLAFFFKNDKNSDNREWSAIQSFGVHYKIQLTLNNVLAVVNYLFFPFTGGKSQLRHEQEPRPGHFELGFELWAGHPVERERRIQAGSASSRRGYFGTILIVL